MALVDWEAVVLDLEDHIQSRSSHGRRDLVDKLAELRSQHRIAEGLVEKCLREYAPELNEALTQKPAGFVPSGTDLMEEESPNRSGHNSGPDLGEEQHADRHTRQAAVR